MPSYVKCHLCPTTIRTDRKTGLCVTCYNNQRHLDKPAVQIAADREQQRIVAEMSGLRRKYQESLKTIAQHEKELSVLGALGSGVSTFAITPKHGSGTSEATPVILASDWHTEEVVTLAQTSGLNEFNEDICKERVTKFFQSSLRLVDLLHQDVKISQVVLALLGDFITGHLHEEAAETNGALPVHAVINAQNLLISGLEFLLNHSEYSYVLPCKVGNHSRTTKKVRFSTENGHSYEHLMYVNLAAYFRNEPRMKFLIEDGYHQYMDIYGNLLRLHHGHAINYQGGVGGITIPANKAIAQWNQGRTATLDAFGHFHTAFDGGTFVANGSLIGYNSYAVSIKARCEPPKQQLFLIDKRRSKTCVWPVFV